MSQLALNDSSKPASMQSRVNSGVITRSLAMALFISLLCLAASAQNSSAVLTINLTVQSSISLVFDNNPSVGNPGFCPLTNPGTNNVGLDLGSASFPGNFHSSACVNYSHISGAIYQVSSAFDVLVNKSNSSSPNYRLAAQISTPPPQDVTWLVDNVTLTSTGFTALTTGSNYSQPLTKTLQVQVKNNVPAQLLQETITFLATAN